MAVFAVYIEKEVRYFGELRRFGNTYHYTTDTGEPFDDALAIQQVSDAERGVLPGSVTFIEGRTWGPTDGPAIDNVMRENVTLGGTGQTDAEASMYREACVLFVWPLERSVPLNRRRWLRKFMRLANPGVAYTPAQLAGSDPLTGANITDLKNVYGDPVTDLSFLGNFRLCTEQGDVPTGPVEVRPYLYTRQIGR